MTTSRELFLASDAGLRSVIDRLPSDVLDKPAPAGWTRKPDPTYRDIVAAHAYDEAWVPDLLAGRTIEEVGTTYDGDLLGDDPVGSYDRLNDATTEVVTSAGEPAEDAIAHLSYGEFPLSEAYLHLSIYRAFQAWSIANELGIDFHLSPEIIAAMNEYIVPNAEMWRQMGAFPPAVEPPAGADEETVLLATLGFWKPKPTV